MNTRTRHSATLAISLAAVATVALSSISMSSIPAPAPNDNPCKSTAIAAKQACKQEALSEFWLQRAKCANLPTHDDRVHCVHDALDELEDAYHDCADQYSARLMICNRLGGGIYHPVIVPANFEAVIDNPLFPVLAGTTFVYESQTSEGLEHDDFIITHATKDILGVTCTVVHDIVSLEGVVIEDTFDWFAQDTQGNVWYFGELSLQLENGVVVGNEGSWEAGVDGASPGIVMKAQPVIGQLYRQEFLIGDAEDVAAAVGANSSAVVPYGSFDHCLETEEFSALDVGVIEHKFYAPGVGLVLETDINTGERTELIDITTN
jgi:hypothetical protein